MEIKLPVYTPPEIFMVIDVESIGLQGEGFAVGFVIITRTGKILHEGVFACPPDRAAGSLENREWVQANVPAILNTALRPSIMRDQFWLEWLEWKKLGAVMVADCAWPVEARFLNHCVNDNLIKREWEGPYPLHDLASMMLVKGLDPLATNLRLENELPAHNPLCDARQSARLLIELLNG